MPSPTDDPLLLSTLHTPRSTAGARAVLPCLTILGHHDPKRIGERALLNALLIAQSVELSRAQPSFTPLAGGAATPLLDQHLTRAPVVLHPEHAGSVRIENRGVQLRVEGSAVSGSHVVSAEQVATGVVLELADRVVLLLHFTSNRALTEVPGLLGQSDAIDDLRRELSSVADLDTSVLLLGETGTGKELIARAIHARSGRRGAQFEAINMAAVPDATAVSTLFGHARGAFTGAHVRHAGLFERASGGTLLLDEIGDTPQAVQPMLLRAIETRRILPLGETGERAVDVRLLAATDADLTQDLDERTFSAALLHRLSGYAIHVPALRERREDIAVLLLRFVTDELATAGEPDRVGELIALLVSSGLLARIVRAPLPGNVRQLQNLARHVVISNRGRTPPVIVDAVERLLGDDRDAAASRSVSIPESSDHERLPSSLSPSLPASPPGSARVAEITEEQLVAALRAHAWSPTRAAASLGVPSGTLHDLMRRSGHVRRAADVSDDELREALDASAGNTREMAKLLSVSERALRITMRRRGLLQD
jgi:two-component system nitrogen regulation response regulator GlnG